MNSIYHIMHEELKRGRSLVLARIARRHGSAPRSTGAWCLVLSDGSLQGSVGGGELEARVAEEAGKMLNQGGTRLFTYRLRQEDAAANGMICGGDMDILLERISPESGAREAIARAVGLMDQGRFGLQLSQVPAADSEEGHSRQGLLDDSGKLWGDLPVPRELVSQGLSSRNEPGLVSTRDGAQYFIDPVRPRSSLVIFGGGHISLPLARMASEVNFGVTVVDDREEFANKERFPFADRVLTAPFAEAFDRLVINTHTYLVIVTRGHVFDREVLRMALRTRAAYTGMIGSRKKIRTIFDSLEGEGYARELLEGVYSPIGLDIGARTPEEIALSIVAELVRVRAGRQRHAGQ